MLLEFPEFLPDLPFLNNPGCTVAKNVIPAGASYKSVPSLVAYSDALSSRARGAISARDPQLGVSHNFVGDATALYLLGNTTAGQYDDVSKAGGYTVAADEIWSFTQFGNRIIAVTNSSNIQSFVMNTSTLFADLSASAPKARYIDTVRDFVMVGNTFDAVDGFVPNRIRWSAIGDSTDWTVSATTQADFQDLDAKYGWVTQVVGGEYGIAFQERAITRFDYIGSPAIFQVTTVEVNQGTQYSTSVIKVGSLVYYIGLDGFYVFDGNQSIPIGVNKVDRFFFDDLNTDYSYLIRGAVDYKNHVVMWAYPSSELGLGEINSRILFYNYSPNATKRWSYADISTELIYTALSEGYTLDQLDDWESQHGLSKNIDILPYSLDSRVWTGNDLLFGAFDSNHKLAFSTGTALSAMIETAEIQLTDGQKSDLFLMRPAIQVNPAATTPATVTMQVGTRNLQNASVTYTSAIPTNSNGDCPTRSNARYHRLRINTSGDFTHAIGVEVLEFQPAGYR